MENIDILSLVKGADRIFVNRNLLNNDYIPSRIVCREDQIRDIAKIFKPIFSDALSSAPSNVIIYGKVGVGKTLVLSYVLRELSSHLNQKGYIVVHLRCDQITVTKILNEIIRSINPSEHLPRTGLSVGTYQQKVYDLLNENSESLILVLDEIDKLGSLEILYSFSRTGEGARKLNKGLHISLILLTNDLSFKERLETRIDSSLASSYIVFPVYTANDLVSILQERLSAFKKGAVSQTVIRLIAALSAQDHGDARKAIHLMRVSGEVAETRGSPIVEESDVQQGFNLLTASQKVEGIKSFNIQLQITVLSTILAALDIKNRQNLIVTREAYEKYQQLCQINSLNLMSTTRFSSYITELDMHNILETDIVYGGRAGKKRRISLLLNQAEITEILQYFTDEHALSLPPFQLPPIRDGR